MIKYNLGTFRLYNEEEKKKKTNRKTKTKQKEQKLTMTVNRTRVNRYYIHHYTIYADTICKALNYIFKPNSNYRLGFKFFFADENIFLTEKIKRYLQNNGIVFSCAIFKTCRIL